MKFGKKPELLSPAGNFEVLTAAVYAGADAVYLGGTQFNARMNADNFDRAGIERAIAFCHERGTKVYLTLNTLIYDRQMKEALEFAGFLANTGVDALIVADMGLAVNLKKYYPSLRLHASTQCGGHNTAAAEYLAGLGFERMVCARELSKENISFLCEHSPIEIEAFVHGALCVSQSGQCLMSSMIGNRSGNRGECAQPCRLPYNGRFPLSLKDNCLAGHIKELLECGVASLKIEGRMKSPEYVYSAVSLYRRLIDEERNASDDEIKRQNAVFSRSGSTDGYFTGEINEKMLGVRTAADKEMSASVHIPIRDNSPVREPIVRVSDKKYPTVHQPVFPSLSSDPAEIRTARFYNPDSVSDEARNYFDIIYLPLDRFDGSKANGVLMPPVIPDSEMKDTEKCLREAFEKGARHILVGNTGHISLAKKIGFTLHGDYRLNIYNSFSGERYLADFEDVILSPELILPQIRDIRMSRAVIVYGRIPLMTLERPLTAELLRDRKGVVFPVLREGKRDIVFNSVPTYMADYSDRFDAAGITNRHFIFTDEGRQGTVSIIRAYEKKLPTKKEIRRIK